jgi:hypothetical protein
VRARRGGDRRSSSATTPHATTCRG